MKQVFSLTQNSDGGVGCELGVTALHHVNSCISHSEGPQGESSRGDVD